MDITLQPRQLAGVLTAIPSKSQAHRLLICAAFADGETTLLCPATNRDIEATADCLRALGAGITWTGSGYHIRPIRTLARSPLLNCHESGSTLRFLLPIVGALGVDATFQMAGRLPQRPLSPLAEELERMGCCLDRPTPTTLRCTGQLRPGHYCIDGGVSSQFITGLRFALSLIPGESTLQITGKIESKPYLDMTDRAMALFGAPRYHSPGTVTVEGDWSNAAFFLAGNFLGSQVRVENLDPESPQGDRAVTELLKQLADHAVIDAAQIPDLVPILAVAAGARRGCRFIHAGRLRLKETDRLETTAAMIRALGGQAEIAGDDLLIQGTGYTGGTVDACNDHRIAMAAAIAATVSTGPVTILGSQAVNKSYPSFWEEYRRLGGYYEQYLR